MNSRLPPFYSVPPPPPPPNSNYHNMYSQPPPLAPPNIQWSSSQSQIQNSIVKMQNHSSNWEKNNHSPPNWDRRSQSPFGPNIPTSTNWERPNNRTIVWKQSRNNWNRFNNIPYTIPKKPFVTRFPQNNGRVGAQGNFYETARRKVWTQNKPPQKKAPAQTTQNDTKSVDNSDDIPGIVQSKKKRKPMSKSYPSSQWDEKDAIKAIEAEKEYAKSLTNQSLIIKFPDPELGKDMVKSFHPSIENVHFPQPSTPRYCFAHLKVDTTNVKEIVSTLEKIPFGQGFLSVELKKQREEILEIAPKNIDPYTLYVGNLPLNVTKAGVKNYFKDCLRLDIGHPQQMKNTRYAFVRFLNVDDAIKAYKSTFNTLYESRSLIVRFRRMNGNVAMPGENSVKQQPKQKLSEPCETIVENNLQLDDQSSSIDSTTLFKDTVSSSSDIIPDSSIMTKEEEVLIKAPDLSLVKEEPTSDNEECEDIKPPVMNGASLDMTDTYSEISIKTENSYIKNENICKNEEDMDEIDELEDDYDYSKDNFRYDGMQEETEDYEEDDDYDGDYDDMGMDMIDEHNYLPGDDDEDLFQ